MMSGTLNETPRSNRLHIGIFGKRNSGKSSLVNALTNQETALVSDVAGTTTDPVYKSMEIHGIGPVVFIDTAGFDDEGQLGAMRVEKTTQALEKTDLALVVFADGDIARELSWIENMKKANIPVIAVVNKRDLMGEEEARDFCERIEKNCGLAPVLVSARERTGMDEIRQQMIRSLPEDYDAQSITACVADPGDTVLLVMPQDIQAPKGRLILPQVQTIRELLDRKCLVMSTTTDQMDAALAAMAKPPDVIITDSQVFKTVYGKKPKESRLTSFSVLFAGYKGDMGYYVESAAAIDRLTECSKVLIAEACTHAPLTEDIGRVKIPKLLRKRVGEGLTIDFAAGADFPKDLTKYQLVIQCGACMFNRKYVLSRVAQAKAQGVPMSNYGVVIAYLNGILDQISY